MTVLVLDATGIGQASHPRGVPEFDDWFAHAIDLTEVVVPAPSELEVRRELLRTRSTLSIARLDRLVRLLHYEEMNLARWRLAAQLWAEARNRGRPTADPKALDVDVLVAAIALSIDTNDEVIVVTANRRHLAQFVDARLWTEITFP